MSLGSSAASSPLAPRLARHGFGRHVLLGCGLAVVATVVGAVAAVAPIAALLPLGALLVIGLAFVAPVAHLMLLLFMTAIVGYELQHRYASHLLPSDALLLSGLLRAAVVMAGQRLDPRRLCVVGLTVAVMTLTVVQIVHGLHAGYGFSAVGAEGRELLGFGTVLIAMPIVADPSGRRRLARGLVIVGLLHGLWGLTQWATGITLGENVDIGLRASTDFATSGRGQLHGGLYGYPVATVMAAAALIIGQARAGAARWWLGAVLATNAVCLILTYERTFWATTAVAVSLVVVRAGRGRRARAAMATLGAATVALAVLALAAPNDLATVQERVLSVGQYSNDNSVRYRVVETDHVLAKVSLHPLFGSGLGDSLYWGRPWEQVPPAATTFAHNGYLWVTWKGGVVLSLLLFALLGWAVVSRVPAERDALMRSLRVGSQAALVSLLLSSLTFPSFNSLTITGVMGVLIAASLAPRARGPAA